MVEYNSSTALEMELVRQFVNLITSDREVFEIPRSMIKLSGLLQATVGEEHGSVNDAFEEVGRMVEVPLPHVSALVLTKIIEFCMHYQNVEEVSLACPLRSTNLRQLIPEWYVEFVEGMEMKLVFEVIMAANYMDIPPLLNLTCGFVASLIKGKTPEEICKLLNIKDFPSEEEAFANDMFTQLFGVSVPRLEPVDDGVPEEET